MDDKDPLALVVGPEVKPLGLSSNSQVFVFKPREMQFIKNLEKLRNVAAAAMSVDWSEGNGTQFIKGRKFQRYLGCRMQVLVTKAAMGEESWWQYCQDLSRGYKERVVVVCGPCGWEDEITPYEAELARRDDMAVEIFCPRCNKAAQVNFVKEPFEPTREQVEGWKEWGNRVSPKTERVHHKFENVNIAFESDGEREGS